MTGKVTTPTWPTASTPMGFADKNGDAMTVTPEQGFPVVSTNIGHKLRDAGEAWPVPFYEQVSIGTDDFIMARGNTGGAGWIEISKSPFTVDDEVLIRVADKIEMPYRVSLLTTMSHRSAGQQIASFEVVSDDEESGLPPTPAPVPVPILNASQATTTITINFDPLAPPAEPYRIGQVVSVYGFVDTRLNVNSATVQTVVSPLQITLVGNDYAFTSTTIGTTLGNGTAFIERYDLLGRARNGFALVQGNGSATQRRFYTRSQGGLARPSGTLAGSHSGNTGTDAATAAAVGYNADAWLPANELLISCSRNAVLVEDRAPNGNGPLAGRFRQTEVVPNPARSYFAQFRVRSVPSMTRPVAKIVTISKAGSTTATVATDGPHGLITGQYVGGYGVRDQTAFPNLTAGTPCTVTGANTFTVVWGTSSTATSYGGFVMRQQGQQPLGGAIAQVAQSISRTDNVVTLIGNTTWAAPTAIGNIVELVGVRDATTGADLGLDGSYAVAQIATTSLTLLPVADHAPVGANITSVNCGGGVIQRLAYRIHSFMAVDYDPMLTESAFKGSQDVGETVGSQLINGTVALSGNPAVVGAAAHDAAISGAPMRIGARAVTTNYAAVAAGDAADMITTLIGALVTKPYATPEQEWSFTGALTAITDVAAQTAAGAGLKRYPTFIQATNPGASAVDLLVRDGTTTRLQITLPAGQSVPLELPTSIPLTANTALNLALSATGTVRVNVLGYTAP